jgi:hypothetical protein
VWILVYVMYHIISIIRFILYYWGKCYWKFNSKLLRDSNYIDIVKTCIRDTLSEYYSGWNINIQSIFLHSHANWPKIKEVSPLLYPASYFLIHSNHSVCSRVRVARSLVFCVVFCRSLFVLLAIVLSVLLRFTDSDYPIGIFQLFF